MAQPDTRFHAESETCSVRWELDGTGEVWTVEFTGRMDAAGLGPVWESAAGAAKRVAKKNASARCRAELGGVEYFDGAGLGFLLELRRIFSGRIGYGGLKPEIAIFLEPFADDPPPQTLLPPRAEEPSLVALGKLTDATLGDLRAQISFVGQLLCLFAGLLARPGGVRWREVFATFQKVGCDALPIVGLIALLMGMILAFQSSIPMRQFGVDIFVVNLVSLAILRELGVIMTAIVFAGRSGSAFAAEIGTMKVNEEISALSTMGLDPARFLVLPRVLAGICAMPLLTVYADAVGIFGGLFVVTTFGHSWAAVWTQLVASASVEDVATGMIKSFVFGFLVSSIGCLRGLQTKSGALAVGESTTRAVVTSILLIIFTDLVFAVVFYATGF